MQNYWYEFVTWQLIYKFNLTDMEKENLFGRTSAYFCSLQQLFNNIIKYEMKISVFCLFFSSFPTFLAK